MRTLLEVGRGVAAGGVADGRLDRCRPPPGPSRRQSPPAWLTRLYTPLAWDRFVALPPYRTPVTDWASVASSRSMTVMVVLSATPKASPLPPTLTVAVPTPLPLT